MSIHSWEETKLWAALGIQKGDTAEGVRTFLKQTMPGIETVLRAGGTSPLDFTLHDSEHSFRVAERMVEIVPADVLENLCDYELALLLLSAYLHDIGMTPERKKVSSHYHYLLTGQDGLSDAEKAAFQKWLDDEGHAVTLPLSEETPLQDRIQLADELITYYCRYRHNDWSKDWIRGNLKGKSLGNYSDWIDDLILLCQSHHYGKDRLITDEFDPRPVGSLPLRLSTCATLRPCCGLRTSWNSIRNALRT